MLRAVRKRAGWGELCCGRRCCQSWGAFSKSNSAPETKQKPRLGRTPSANPISAWKPSLTQSLARRQGDPPSVSPSLLLSWWPDGHPGFLAVPETAGAEPPGAWSRTPPHPAPRIPQRSRLSDPAWRRPPGSRGHPPAAGQCEGGGRAAPAPRLASPARTRPASPRAHLTCPWSARRAPRLPPPLRCAALSFPAGPAQLDSGGGGRAAAAPPPERPGPRLIRQ